MTLQASAGHGRAAIKAARDQLACGQRAGRGGAHGSKGRPAGSGLWRASVKATPPRHAVTATMTMILIHIPSNPAGETASVDRGAQGRLRVGCASRSPGYIRESEIRGCNLRQHSCVGLYRFTHRVPKPQGSCHVVSYCWEMAGAGRTRIARRRRGMVEHGDQRPAAIPDSRYTRNRLYQHPHPNLGKRKCPSRNYNAKFNTPMTPTFAIWS